MPPKAKFTEKEIIDTAIDIVEQDGIDALTARRLGAELGSSARPIFTTFKCMDDVITMTTARADEIYTSYVKQGLTEQLPFKGVGMSYIRFATDHPKLFRLLFMHESAQTQNADSVLKHIEPNYDLILNSIINIYGIEKDLAYKLYMHIWIYTHGIAVLIATKVCSFTTDEASQMLTQVFTGLLIRAKKGELQ
ncbi:MAG: WHG domain-containing protein [Firmicutes bacterium]|nr:WHG domain-containing protein [Bacillota bacterium]